MRLKLKDPRALIEFSPGIGDTEGFVMFLFGIYGGLIRNFDILGNAFLSVMSGIRDTVKSVVYDTCSLNYNPKRKGVGSILLGIRTQKI